MRARISLGLITLLLVAAIPITLFAQTATITGRVTDASNGEALPGANVLLEGTTLGAATNINGEYRILRVPAGTYAVRAIYMGYTGLSQTDRKSVV